MEMRVETLGQDEPRLAIVGAIHGDEPCGAHAIETLLDADPDVTRPVKCITVNERALARNMRYTERDLNRVFPGDPDADAYETRLAHELLEELHGCITLSMHSTQSDERPFALVNTVGSLAMGICPYLSVVGVIETGELIGQSLVDHTPVIDVECGLQGTDQAAANAVQLVREFLAVTGALPDMSVEQHRLHVYRLCERIPKQRPGDCDVLVKNFEPVPAGTPYASIDNHVLVAEDSFHPVLLSASGYESQFGYAAELIGTLGHD